MGKKIFLGLITIFTLKYTCYSTQEKQYLKLLDVFSNHSDYDLHKMSSFPLILLEKEEVPCLKAENVPDEPRPILPNDKEGPKDPGDPRSL